MSVEVAIVHDYLTQRGGAERVVLTMSDAFRLAPIHTALYEPSQTYAEFGDRDIRPSVANLIGPLRRHHRIGLPLYAPIFSSLMVDAQIVLCSSSGWAHGVRTGGRKLVYCYAPARWLYQTKRYAGDSVVRRIAALALRPTLRRWDKTAALSADHYITSSRAVRTAIQDVYGIDATLLPPPHYADPSGHQTKVIGVEPGFSLCIARLLPYKNVDVVVEAAKSFPRQQFVIVGDGPERPSLEKVAPPNVTFLGVVEDSQLRWLYANCSLLLAASFEDYGLTPLEAAAYGKPTVALRAGGYLDTIVEEKTGAFFDEPHPSSLVNALGQTNADAYRPRELEEHAKGFSVGAFQANLRRVVLDAGT